MTYASQVKFTGFFDPQDIVSILERKIERWNLKGISIRVESDGAVYVRGKITLNVFNKIEEFLDCIVESTYQITVE